MLATMYCSPRPAVELQHRVIPIGNSYLSALAHYRFPILTVSGQVPTTSRERRHLGYTICGACREVVAPSHRGLVLESRCACQRSEGPLSGA